MARLRKAASIQERHDIYANDVLKTYDIVWVFTTGRDDNYQMFIGENLSRFFLLTSSVLLDRSIAKQYARVASDT